MPWRFSGDTYCDGNRVGCGKFQNLDPKFFKFLTFYVIFQHSRDIEIEYQNRNLHKIVVILVVDLVL